MKLYPAIDLREGATVQLVGGDPTQEKVHEPDPLKVALRWVDQGASMLHLVDLDAALGSGNNLHVVDRILANIPLPVQLGGGVRHLVDIQRRLDMGVGRVIVGTQAIKHPDWFATACDLFKWKLILAVDARGEDVAVSGWQEASGLSLATALERVDDLPLAGILYTNVDVEGRMEGVDRAAVEHVVSLTEHKLIASGGIGGMEDLDILRDVGVDAAVLGMSIYTGRVALKDAIEHIEGRKVATGRHGFIPKPEVAWGVAPEVIPRGRLLRASDGYDDDLDDNEEPYDEGLVYESPDEPEPDAERPNELWGRRRRDDDDEDETEY